jgi:hypothetical protein
MLTEEQAANPYEEVTDGYRRLVRVTSDYAPRWQRVNRIERLILLRNSTTRGSQRVGKCGPQATFPAT